MVKKVQASKAKALEEEAAAAAAAEAEANGESPAEKPEENGVEPQAEEAAETPATEKEPEDKKEEVKEKDVKPEEKKTPKPAKKVIPSWATIDRTNVPKSKLATMEKPKVLDRIIDILKEDGGAVSVSRIKSELLDDSTNLKPAMLKKIYLKGVASGVIKQVKGVGFSGSCKLGKEKAPESKKGGKVKPKKGGSDGKPSLETIFPHVFTWATNGKEASVLAIRKYLKAHYPELDSEGDVKLKKQLETRENGGQLERICGKGFSGTFKLVDDARKTPGVWSDMIENAILAMNEPKEVSVPTLRDYLSVYHPEYNTDDRPIALKRALDSASDKGWISQITGRGFSGTYRLMWPYFPSPKELWGKDYVDPEEEEEKKEQRRMEKEKKQKEKDKAEKAQAKKASKKRPADDSDDEDDEDEDDEDAEIISKPKKRGPPSPRKSAAPPKKVAKKPAAKKNVKTKPVAKKVKGKGKK